MNIILMIVVLIITAVLSLTGGILLITNKKTAKFLNTFGPAVAAVVILSTVFGDIIPEILGEERMTWYQVLLWTLIGLAVCLGIGTLLGRIHKHDEKRALHNRRQAYGMMIVDSLHALADGVILGVAFTASPTTGILTAASTVAHEIPQEIGDFAIMLRSGIKKSIIILLQLASSALMIPTAIIAYFLGDILEPRLPMVLALVAGSLIYIAIGEIRIAVQDFKKNRRMN